MTNDRRTPASQPSREISAQEVSLDSAGGAAVDRLVEKAPESRLGSDPIQAERYINSDFMKLEWERVWTKVWLLAGPVTDLVKPGDYFTTTIGLESILIVRGHDGRVRAVYNV